MQAGISASPTWRAASFAASSPRRATGLFFSMPRRATIPPELQLRSRRIRSRSTLGERLTYLFLGLFILPHTLIGVGFLLAMPGSIMWALLGEDHAASVERLWSTRQKGGRAYHVAYSYDLPSSRERRHAETTIRLPL